MVDPVKVGAAGAGVAEKVAPGLASKIAKVLAGGGAAAAGGGYLLNSILGAGAGAAQAPNIVGQSTTGGGAGGGNIPGGSYSPPPSTMDVANQAMKISNPTLVTISSQLDRLLNLTSKTNASIDNMSSLTRYNMDRQAKMERETRLETQAAPLSNQPGVQQGQEQGSGFLGMVAQLVGAGVAAGLAAYFGKSLAGEPGANQDQGTPGAPSTPGAAPGAPAARPNDPGAAPGKGPAPTPKPGIMDSPGEYLGDKAREIGVPESLIPDFISPPPGQAAAPSSSSTPKPKVNDAGPGSFVSPLPTGQLITSGVGWRPSTNSNHLGLDMPTEPTTVKATAKGKVIEVGWHRGYGRTIVIWHGGPKKVASLYAHLSAYKVKLGDEVSAGQPIAVSGNSGTRTTGPHLHFEIRENFDPKRPVNVSRFNGTGVDPARYVSNIPKNAGSNRGGVKRVAEATPADTGQQMAMASPAPGPVESAGGVQLASLSTPAASNDSYLSAPPGHDPSDFSDVAARNNAPSQIGGVDLDPSHYDNLGPGGQPDEYSKLKPQYTELGRNMQAAMSQNQGMFMAAALPAAAAPAPAVTPPPVTPMTPPSPGASSVVVPTPANDVNAVRRTVTNIIMENKSNPQKGMAKIAEYLTKIGMPKNKWTVIIVGALAALGIGAVYAERLIRKYLPDLLPAETQPAPTEVPQTKPEEQPATPVPTVPAPAPVPTPTPETQPAPAPTPETQPAPAPETQPATQTQAEPAPDAQSQPETNAWRNIGRILTPTSAPTSTLPPIIRPTPFFVPPSKERDRYKGGGDWRFKQTGRGEVAGLTFKLREIDKNPGVALGASRGSGRLGLGKEMPLRGIIADRLVDTREPFEDYDKTFEEDGRVTPTSGLTSAKTEEMPAKPTKAMSEPFWKAFKAARARAKGPKGWFTWNGKKYQTNYKNEPYLPISKLKNVDEPVAQQATPAPTVADDLTSQAEAAKTAAADAASAQTADASAQTADASANPTPATPVTPGTPPSSKGGVEITEQDRMNAVDKSIKGKVVEMDPMGGWAKLEDGKIVDPNFPDNVGANLSAKRLYNLQQKSQQAKAATPVSSPTPPTTNLMPADEGNKTSPQRVSATQMQAEDTKTNAVVALSKKPPRAINGNSPANPAAQMRGKRLQQDNSPPPSAGGGRGATQSEVPEPGAGDKLKEYQLYFNSTYAIETTF